MHKYFEIDFQESSAKKAATIKKNKAFTDVIGDPDLKVGKVTNSRLHGSFFFILGLAHMGTLLE